VSLPVVTTGKQLAMDAADATARVGVLSAPPEALPASKERSARARAVPVLEPQPGGPAERVARHIGATHPVRVFLVSVIAGCALLAALTISAGLLLTQLLVPVHGFEKWDNDVNRWLAEHRSPVLTDLSWLGSTFAGGLVIPVVVGVLLVVFVVRRAWLLAAFTLFLICVESGSYRATTLVVNRDRPPVHRLEGLDPTASFPSGHIAATVALYGGLLLLLASWLGRRPFSALAFALAIGLALFVGWARMYRGMHHLTDTAAGVVMGLLALGITVLAARAAAAAANARDAARGEGA
jgi:membrane-associated phospholipid phosphatase